MYFSSVPPHEAITSDIASKYVRSSARSRSGSSCSPSSVEPITSAKRIVATLRSSHSSGLPSAPPASGSGSSALPPRASATGFGCNLQRRVLIQYLALELFERRARLDPDLLDERLPPALEDLQRVRLPSAAIEGEHQLGAHAHGTAQRRRGAPARRRARGGGRAPDRRRTDPRAHLDAARRSGRSRSERTARSGGRPMAPRARARAPRAGSSRAPRGRVAAAPPRSASRTGPDRPPSTGPAADTRAGGSRITSRPRSLRRAEMCPCNAVCAVPGSSPQSASISCAPGTTSLRWRSSIASSARCFGRAGVRSRSPSTTVSRTEDLGLTSGRFSHAFAASLARVSPELVRRYRRVSPLLDSLGEPWPRTFSSTTPPIDASRTGARRRVREETYGEDIGQNSWLTRDEWDSALDWLVRIPGRTCSTSPVARAGPTSTSPARAGRASWGWTSTPTRSGRRTKRLAATASPRSLVSCKPTRAPLPFADASFDAVVCVDAINHLPDRLRVLRDWHRASSNQAAG